MRGEGGFFFFFFFFFKFFPLKFYFFDKKKIKKKKNKNSPSFSLFWFFPSLLISGSYLHDLFRVIDLDEDDKAQIEKYQKSNNATNIPDHYLGMYKIPKRDNVSGTFRPEWAKNVKTERISRKIEQQGSIYFLGMDFPHQITIDLNAVGSMITLVLTSETNRENLYTLQPITRPKTFENPSPNVDEKIVRDQLEIILDEI